MTFAFSKPTSTESDRQVLLSRFRADGKPHVGREDHLGCREW